MKVPWTGFGTSPDASFEVFLSPSIGASNGCAHGGGGATSEWLWGDGFEVAAFGGSEMGLERGSEGDSGAGLKGLMRGSKGRPSGGVVKGIFLPQSAFSKWNMRKVSIFRAWKSPVLPRNSAVFGKNWASSATIHPESDCNHIRNIQVTCRVF